MTDEFSHLWETLPLDETLRRSPADEIDLGATITNREADDWRDTLRDSLPLLPLGPNTSSHFQIARVLGRGGMGVVHLARQRALGRDVAIKTVPPDQVSREGENALLQEARAMGLVEHPNVVPVHMIGQDDDGRPVIVMKRIDGTSWLDYIEKRAKVPSEDALGFHLNVLIAVCRAVAFAHDRMILHRDIKPENVMIGRFGEIYLLDWGLAVSTDPDVERLPFADNVREIVGTPAYMAPEMTTGEGHKQGPHTDVFLLGAVLYNVITGEPPNRGRSLFEVFRFSYEGHARQYPLGVSSELAEISERAMALDPKDRFRSANEMREAIESFLSHRNSHVLVEASNQRFNDLRRAIADEQDDTVHQLFGETRFGFISALEIWPENVDAKVGLRDTLLAMIAFELSREDVRSARLLYAQLDSPPAKVKEEIDALAAALDAREEKLAKLAFDYDEDVGIEGRRWLVAAMAMVFTSAPFIIRLFEGLEVPAYLRWLSDDPIVLIANAFGFGFVPILLAYALTKYRRVTHHKVSRIFFRGFSWMYMLGLGARTTTLWGGASLAHAAAAECAVYASGLWVLGLAVDRRFGAPAIAFLGTSFALVLYPDRPLDIYSIGAVVGCISFLLYDYFRRDR